MSLQRRPTKREVLSMVMSIYDPLGFLANISITGKIIMQSLWNFDLNWDDQIPDSCFNGWIAWVQEMKKVRDFAINRCYFTNFVYTVNELHLFSDASEQAMAVVAYWRILAPDGIHVSFICGKTNCAPSKYQSIPKLELQAAVYAVRLKCQIVENHSVKPDKVQFWSDSATVVKWVQSDARKYKQYVANRIGEILESSSVSSWRWLPGAENPADDATRFNLQYKVGNRWQNGPTFLKMPESSWPSPDRSGCQDECATEQRSKYFVLSTNAVSNNVINFERFSNYRRLKRCVAWMMRFVFNAKNRSKRSGDLTVEEEEYAETLLCRAVQKSCFGDEYNNLKKKKPVDAHSDLKTLCPYIDESGVLRVQGRLDNAFYLSNESKRPIILPKKHPLTNLVVYWYHQRLNHINVNTTINEIRQRFWVPAIRMVVNRVQGQCCWCKLKRAKPGQPIMGPLPVDRLTPYVRPFSYTGLDYIGPIEVTIRRQREKRWIALFTCLSIRAVHLEVAANLSSDACLMCIKNFVNRRGVPVQIRSDNGTNFVGLSKELAGENNYFDSEQVASGLVPFGIKWKFNTPTDSSAGGVWERLVQSVKKSLLAILKEHAPRLETLYSVLVETENIVNSRPLTHLPVSPEQPEPLTPNHFLLGGMNSTQTPGDYQHKQCAARKQWRILQNLKNAFWKRWLQEYLPELTRRSKWFRASQPLQSGSLVLICETNEPRSKWKRGKVLRLIIGKDGVARSAEVSTATGVLSRPVNKLAILDMEKDGESPGVNSRGVGCHL